MYFLGWRKVPLASRANHLIGRVPTLHSYYTYSTHTSLNKLSVIFSSFNSYVFQSNHLERNGTSSHCNNLSTFYVNYSIFTCLFQTTIANIRFAISGKEQSNSRRGIFNLRFIFLSLQRKHCFSCCL